MARFVTSWLKCAPVAPCRSSAVGLPAAAPPRPCTRRRSGSPRRDTVAAPKFLASCVVPMLGSSRPIAPQQPFRQEPVDGVQSISHLLGPEDLAILPVARCLVLSANRDYPIDSFLGTPGSHDASTDPLRDLPFGFQRPADPLPTGLSSPTYERLPLVRP